MAYQHTLIILTLSFLYAFIRYHLAAEVPLDQFPIYIANKAISFSALYLICMSSLVREKTERKTMGLLGVLFSAAHLQMSFLIMNPDYFEKFYSNDKLNAIGGTSMLFGILGFSCLVVLLMATFMQNNQHHIDEEEKASLSLIPGLGRIAIIFGGLHVLVMGVFTSWKAPMNWYWGLPPITLLAFLVCVSSLLTICLRNRQSKMALEKVPALSDQ